MTNDCVPKNYVRFTLVITIVDTLSSIILIVTLISIRIMLVKHVMMLQNSEITRLAQRRLLIRLIEKASLFSLNG